MTRPWRVVNSLQVLLSQLNALAPNRSKVSDGSIGDVAHSSRESDHNPDAKGNVHARDFTHDPKGGLDCNWLAQALINSHDRRIKYIIWWARIWEPGKGWQAYHGTNPHKHHLHLSVVASKLCENGDPWDLRRGTVPSSTRPVLQVGSKGPDVKFLQIKLGIPADGEFGPQTETAVKKFQRSHGLSADGVVGPLTWEKLR